MAAVFLLLHLLLSIEIIQLSLLQVRGRLNSTSWAIQTLSFKALFLPLMYLYNHLHQYGPIYLFMGNHFSYFLCPLKVHKCLGLGGKTKTRHKPLLPLLLSHLTGYQTLLLNASISNGFSEFSFKPNDPNTSDGISQQIDLCGGWPNWRSES